MTVWSHQSPFVLTLCDFAHGCLLPCVPTSTSRVCRNTGQKTANILPFNGHQALRIGPWPWNMPRSPARASCLKFGKRNPKLPWQRTTMCLFVLDLEYTTKKENWVPMAIGNLLAGWRRNALKKQSPSSCPHSSSRHRKYSAIVIMDCL